MPELYEYPPTRSQRAKWALEELGIEYSSHMVDLHEGQRTSWCAFVSIERRSLFASGKEQLHVPVARVCSGYVVGALTWES